MDIVLTVFWGVVVLALLVVVHELGHFVAARGFGVRVTEFMIGLPGPNIGFERGGTKYGITAIPLGGYNRITGMEGGPEDPNLASVLAYTYRQGKVDVEHTAAACHISEEDAELALVILDGWGSINKPGRSNKTGLYAAPKTETLALGEPREVDDPKALLDAEREHTYRKLPLHKRLVVLLAGPVFNIVFALALLLVIFCGIGSSVATTTLADVAPDGPAAAAGLRAGDTVTSIAGEPVDSWDALVTAVSGLAAGQEVEVGYERDGAHGDATVKVGQSANGGPQLGIVAGTEQHRMGVVEALQTSWEYFTLTVGAYVNLFNPVTAAETVEQSTSVVGISVMAKQAATTGIVPLLYILAVISMSLGIVNLVPLPPLDGGKIVVEVVQKAIGREVPVRIINAITVVAIGLLVVLFLVLLRQDILRFVLGGG